MSDWVNRGWQPCRRRYLELALGAVDMDEEMVEERE